MYTTRIECLNLKQVADSGQCFRWNVIGEKKYSVIAFGKYVEITQEGCDFTFSCEEDEYLSIWRNYLDLETDYPGLCDGIRNGDDEFLKRAVEYGGGIRILNQELWEMLISFIISQNNNIPRIRKNIESICEKFGEPVYFKGEKKGYSFPKPEVLSKIELSDLDGLSLGYRDRYIISAAQWYIKEKDGLVPMLYNMDVHAQKETMKKCILGVGEKVANCIVLFGLHSLSGCPIDTWMKKLINEDYGGEKPEWMTDRYAGIYQQYAFYYKRENKADV